MAVIVSPANWELSGPDVWSDTVALWPGFTVTVFDAHVPSWVDPKLVVALTVTFAAALPEFEITKVAVAF